MKTVKIDKSDWGYVNVDPDPDFDPEHNRRVVDEALKKARLYRDNSLKAFREKTKERVVATAKYIDALQGDKVKSAESYFGKKYLTHLRGREIRDRIMNAKKEVQGKTESI